MVTKRVQIAIVSTVCVLGAIGAWAFLPATGSFPIPPRRLPSPNAYDLYKQPGTVHKLSRQLEEAFSSNKASVDQMRTFVAANAADLAVGSRGAIMPYSYGAPRSWMNDDKAYYDRLIRLKWLQIWQSRVKAADGDAEAASSAALTVVRMGCQIPHGAGISDALRGASTEATGRKYEWPLVNKLTAVEACKAAADIAGIDAQEVSLSDTLHEERLIGLSDLEGGPTIMRSRATLAHYSNYVDALITYADQPYDAKSKAPAESHDVFASLMIIDDIDRVRLSRVNCRTQNALLETSLALRAYYADHKVYPSTLQALIPAYLPTIPHDPFASKGELRYQIDGKSYKLYSIGPDGIDDGGKPILNHINDGYLKKKMRDTRFVMRESRGDVVAGINF